MTKMFIALKKYFYVKPKWRILRVYTKTVPRSKLEKLRQLLESEIRQEKDEVKIAFLKGKAEIITLLLK